MKIDLVRKSILDILSEHAEGVSLAQLPLYLQRKMQDSIDIASLGFPKLKDLILTMNDKIKLELKSHNHPIASLIIEAPKVSSPKPTIQ